MSDLAFEKVKRIRHEPKDIVFGYVRRLNQLNIPQSIQYTILLFYFANIESNILTDDENDKLLKLFEEHGKFSYLTEYNRIYTGSKNGFDQKSFVEQCHNKENLQIIIHTTDNAVFGAYTSTGWNGVPSLHLQKTSDEEAFLFFARNETEQPFAIANVKKANASTSIVMYNGYYCYFRNSIWLSDNCNVNTKSGTCKNEIFGFEYADKSIAESIMDKHFGCAPSTYKWRSFTVSDFEVIQLKLLNPKDENVELILKKENEDLRNQIVRLREKMKKMETEKDQMIKSLEQELSLLKEKQKSAE